MFAGLARCAPKSRLRLLAILPIAVAIWVILPSLLSAQTPPGGPSTPGAPGSPKKPDTVTDTCVTAECHAGIADRKVTHGPVAAKKCGACHVVDEPREHRFKFANAKERLCADCHTMQNRTVVHTVVKQGLCTGCHDPHGSDHRKMLKADPARGLCVSCHKQQDASSGKKFVHGPVATGACILCHEPHSSWQPKLLIATTQSLCTNCHTELVGVTDASRHIHAPVKDNCVGCHDAHASNEKYQLKQSTPDLCLSCHDKMKQHLASSTVVHGAVKQTGGCMGCHTPHASPVAKLQKGTQPQTCLANCHDHPLKTADGRELADMGKLLHENPQQHGPIREGACTACHQPHAGERFRLLAAEYPPQFYAPFKLEMYGLCFTCHIPDLVLKKEGTGLTGFRDKDLNLHWVHVNQEKGRTCRACHEVHASKRAFHVREAVPFGEKGWMLEINYQQTSTGGSCSPACHKPRSYDHGVGAPVPNLREVKNVSVSK